jgi:hypothetical protein
MSVEPRRYRFRILNFCNARFLELKIADASSDRPNPPIWQIGTDGGLLDKPVALSGSLLLAPAERADTSSTLRGSRISHCSCSIPPTPPTLTAICPTRRRTARSCSFGSIFDAKA